MPKHIRTSEENKEIVSKLTRKFNLGAENVIARIALIDSLARGVKLNLDELKDSKGKEYSLEILFGNHSRLYLGILANSYKLKIDDNDIYKLVKIHIDEGLQYISLNYMDKTNGFEIIKSLINNSLAEISS